MCELLVKAVDASHADPLIDRHCYKRGDVVVVMPDGHEWGAGELDESVFTVVVMPGVPVDAMSYLIGSQIEPLRQTAALKIPVLRSHLQRQPRPDALRRRYKIDFQSPEPIDKTRP